MGLGKNDHVIHGPYWGGDLETFDVATFDFDENYDPPWFYQAAFYGHGTPIKGPGLRPMQRFRFRPAKGRGPPKPQTQIVFLSHEVILKIIPQPHLPASSPSPPPHPSPVGFFFAGFLFAGFFRLTNCLTFPPIP